MRAAPYTCTESAVHMHMRNCIEERGRREIGSMREKETERERRTAKGRRVG